MDTAPRSGQDQAKPPSADSPPLLPIRFRRDPADRPGIDPQHGMMPAKRPEPYYLDALPAIFQPGVALPGPLGVAERFTGAEVVLLNPGPSSAEVLGILTRFPEIKFLHVIESSEAHLAAIRSELEAEAADRPLPELAGYSTDLRHLPQGLAGRADLVVAVNVFDPKADRLFRQDALEQISRVLKLGGLFYSAGVTIRWTDEVTPLSLVTIPIAAEFLKQVGYSDALPPPVFFLKRPTDAPIPAPAEAEEGTLREWWNKVVSLIGPGTEADAAVAVETPFVPRVEAGRGEPNPAPWNFLITKPAIRRPAMEWTPKAGDPFGHLTLGTLLQHNPETGMHVFRVQEHAEVVLKLMKPFEGDIPDDPLDWEKLSKSKTLKRENQALKLLKGLRFIPQRMAHGYDPLTGWYAIVVEHEASPSLEDFMDRQYHRLRRHHETAAEVERALQAVLMVLNALEIVHGKGLVHQDLKPGHVLLRADSREAVLIDWGLARRIDELLSEEKRSISWLHAPPERADINVLAHAAIHQDLYAVGVMLLQLGSDVDLKLQPRFLFDYFLQHGRMPAAAELEPGLRTLWKWAAPAIARAISSRKTIPGYADHRFTSAPEMARELVQSYGKTPAAFESGVSSEPK